MSDEHYEDEKPRPYETRITPISKARKFENELTSNGIKIVRNPRCSIRYAILNLS
jgi:hypothetical protein